MADHVDANSFKGAGKSPRSSPRKRSRNSRTTQHHSPSPSSRIPVPTKRKSLTDNKSSKSKNPRLEEETSKRSYSKGKKKPIERASRSSVRELRKRKSEESHFPSSFSSEESETGEEEEEILKTERDKKVDQQSSTGLLSRTSVKDRKISGGSRERTKTNSRTQSAAGLPAGSSSSSVSVSSTGTRHSTRQGRSSASTTQIVPSSLIPTRNKSKVKVTSTSTTEAFTPSLTAPSTSEEETREQAASSNISARLRPTAGRAAAAASLKFSLQETAEGGSSKSKGKQSKPFKFGRKAHSGGGASSTTPTSTTHKSQEPEDSTNPPTTTDTDEQDETGSSSTTSQRTTSYQLRSYHSSDGHGSGTNRKSAFASTRGSKRGSSVSIGGGASTLRGAQILSEKEKSLQRKSPGTSIGGSKSVGGSNTTTASVSGSTNSTRSARLSAVTGKLSTGNTTGACTSTRCGRGGGPSSASGTIQTKPGEAGMSTPPTSSTASTTAGQSTTGIQSAPGSGSTGPATSTTSTVLEGGSSASSLTAAAAASSAFGRGLAMLTGEVDGDEGEMGRLQALLEARGLPPHLFGSLAPRMQQLLNRGMNSTTVSKAQQLLQGLQATGDEGQQLQAAIEMCQLLVMGNEDTLAGFPVKQTVPALITLLSMEHNFDMMNHACRALTYMMEALPRSTPVVAEAVPVFLEKLQVIQCMDVAEQSLTALEMLSRRHAKTILLASGVNACLTYLDFFSITAQRAALAVTANCCQTVHTDEFHLISNSLGFLAGRLTEQDKKSVESVCLTFSRLIDSFTNDPAKLEEIASPTLLGNLQQLLVVTPPVVSTGTFILILRLLAQLCSRCPKIGLKLLEQNIVSTLSSLLLGSSTPNTESVVDEVELVPRNPQELLEIVTVIGELLPKLPKDGIFEVNNMMTHPHVTCQDAIQWQWRDDRGGWTSYSAFDSRIIEGAHQAGEDEISLTLQSRTYTIDFLGMQQLNEETGTARHVQRKINPFYNPRAPVTGKTEPTEKVEEDVRSTYLESHPGFTLPFLRPLFALLSEANSSSAGPAVRQVCVKTLLRIAHFLTPEALQKTLRPQQVSNNLASMLGSSDLKIVVGAFQLSTLFMDKLTDVYMVHFRREGVFHQISRISTSDVVGPSPIKSDISTILAASGIISGGGGSSSSTSSCISSSIPTVSSNNKNPIPLDLNVPVIPCPLNPCQYSNTTTTSNSEPPAALLDVGGDGEEVVDSNPNFPLLLQHNSPYGLCLGGFFMQPGAAASSSTPLLTSTNSSMSLPSIPTMTSVETQPNLNLVAVVAPPTSLNSALSGAVLPNETAPPVPPPHAHVLTPIFTMRGLSSGSSSDLNAPVTVSTTNAEKKAAEAEQSAAMDQFKRKRTSKRLIPTSSRRLRQEEPNGGTSSSDAGGKKDESGTSSSAQSGGGAGGSGRRGGSKTSGFFASLHPSRWTRGSGPNPSGTTQPNSNNNNNAPAAAAASAAGTPSSSSSSTNMNLAARASTSSAYLAITYKEQIKSWLKEQSIDFTQKYCSTSMTGDGMDTSNGSGIDGILPKLGEIILELKNERKVLSVLEELRTVVLESDISPFELNHSGLIGALLGFLVDTKEYTMPREQRLRSFIHVFANCPLNELSGESLEECLGSGSKTSAFSLLVTKLNSCLSQLEQFQVKVHEMPTSSGSSRVAPSSALRFFNTHQLKCVLQRHPNCTSLRQWKGGPVKIDPLALVQAIERYLLIRGFGRPREPRDSGDSDEDNSEDDIDDSLAAVVISQGATRHKLQFIMNDQVLPYNMTVYQAIRQFGSPTMDLGSELEGDFIDPATAVIGSSGIWSQTHTIYYRPLSEDGVSPALAPTTSKSTKKGKSPSTKGLKSKKDPLWHEGIVPIPEPPYVKYLSSSLESVTISDPSLPVLTLLRVIHGISRHWHSLYWPVLPGLPLIPYSEFINTKVAAKAQRQLQDPVVIMTGNLPCWLQQIGNACPFLFPFETRQMLFYSTSFDRDRALQRLLDSVPELNSQEREDRVTPRLDRRKRTISRDQILAQAEQLMQDFGSSRPLLEVQYENEVGTGLGPTLEFYALVSQELQKKELDLWHCESSLGDEITSEKSKSYVQTSVGLFPKPLGKSVKTTVLSKVKSKFKFIGKFMAKAVMDSRMIDIPLSKTQYKWILGAENSLSLGDMADVDSTVAQSIKKLVSVVSAKKKLEHTGLSGTEMSEALESLTLDGCRIDNLGLDFTLPGHPTIELRKGGRDTTVTIYNLEEYIKLVVHWMLVGGVNRQMESWREGFDTVFPSSALRIFYPEELEMVFCGATQSVGENWDIKTLSDCCRPDHGFTLESRAIQFLFEVMASYDAQERRKFVQFVTGSPRLPVGGFKALQPQLTIVRKTIESGDEDSFLPSVMTCVNYLKLPDYSTIEIMRERLRIAAEEGQMSFHLS